MSGPTSPDTIVIADLEVHYRVGVPAEERKRLGVVADPEGSGRERSIADAVAPALALPREARQPRPDHAWGALESNRFGTNEFIEYCRELGTEPFQVARSGHFDGARERAAAKLADGAVDGT